MNKSNQPIEKIDLDLPVHRGHRLSATGGVIHPTAQIVASIFEPWTEVGEGARIVNTTFQAYSYCDRFADIATNHAAKVARRAGGLADFAAEVGHPGLGPRLRALMGSV